MTGPGVLVTEPWPVMLVMWTCLYVVKQVAAAYTRMLLYRWWQVVQLRVSWVGLARAAVQGMLWAGSSCMAQAS